MSVAKKRKHITLEDKYNAIQSIDKEKLNHATVAAELGIDRITVSKWCGKEKKTIEKANAANIQSNRKKLRKGKYELIEQSLLEWFAQKRATNPNISINGPLL